MTVSRPVHPTTLNVQTTSLSLTWTNQFTTGTFERRFFHLLERDEDHVQTDLAGVEIDMPVGLRLARTDRIGDPAILDGDRRTRILKRDDNIARTGCLVSDQVDRLQNLRDDRQDPHIGVLNMDNPCAVDVLPPQCVCGERVPAGGAAVENAFPAWESIRPGPQLQPGAMNIHA